MDGDGIESEIIAAQKYEKVLHPSARVYCAVTPHPQSDVAALPSSASADALTVVHDNMINAVLPPVMGRHFVTRMKGQFRRPEKKTYRHIPEATTSNVLR